MFSQLLGDLAVQQYAMEYTGSTNNAENYHYLLSGIH